MADRAIEEIAAGHASATGRGPARPGPHRGPRPATARPARPIAGGGRRVGRAPRRRRPRPPRRGRRAPAGARARSPRPGGGLADAREQAQRRPHAYAIIPYEGPNQTHRRPIYLECRADAVVLQPEGIVFVEADFAGRWGRAIRWRRRCGRSASTCSTAAASIPAATASRIRCCWSARRASPLTMPPARPCNGGTSDFGYELIEDDWKLEFPRPDPQLAKVVLQAIGPVREELAAAADDPCTDADAALRRTAATAADRRRRPWLLMGWHTGVRPAMARAAGEADSERAAVRARRKGPGGGGFGTGGGPGGGGGGPGGGGSGMPAVARAAAEAVQAEADSEWAVAVRATAGSGFGMAGGAQRQRRKRARNPGRRSGQGGGSGFGMGDHAPATAEAGGGMAAAPGSGGRSESAGPGGGSGLCEWAAVTQAAAAADPAAGAYGGGPAGGTSGGLAGKRTQAGPAAASAAAARQRALPGNPLPTQRQSRRRRPADRARPSSANPSRRPTGVAAAAGGGRGRPAPLRPGEWRRTLSPPETRADDKDKNKDRRAWPRPAARTGASATPADRSTPLTRPIRIECYTDRLVLAPEPGYGSPKAIPLGRGQPGSSTSSSPPSGSTWTPGA